jgi:hypothetical protein
LKSVNFECIELSLIEGHFASPLQLLSEDVQAGSMVRPHLRSELRSLVPVAKGFGVLSQILNGSWLEVKIETRKIRVIDFSIYFCLPLIDGNRRIPISGIGLDKQERSTIVECGFEVTVFALVIEHQFLIANVARRVDGLLGLNYFHLPSSFFRSC